MRVETKYIANDGKEFDNEYACKKYEYELLNKKCGVIMLDKDLEPIDDFEYCIYCIIKTEEDYDILQAILDYEGYTCPNGVGVYYYNVYNDKWHNLKDKVDELEEELNEYRKILEM